MKAKIDAIIQREQAEYLDQLLAPSHGLLKEMEEYAGEHRVPIADREVALFLEITARAIKARRVLECGMAIGYSVIHLARAMGDDGLVITIDPSEKMIAAAEDYFVRAKVRERVQIERGYALDVIPHLHETFDLVFIDAVKEEYQGYIDLALPKLRPGGVVIVDNLLWGGLRRRFDYEVHGKCARRARLRGTSTSERRIPMGDTCLRGMHACGKGIPIRDHPYERRMPVGDACR